MTTSIETMYDNTAYTYDPELKKCTVLNAEHFPQEVFELADNIEVLDMSGGRLTELPDNFSQLRNLKIVNFMHNDFTEIPSVLGACDKLEVAIFASNRINTFGNDVLPASIRGITLTNNQLVELPDSISHYKNLQKLTLAGNKLRRLPRGLLDCPSLVMLRLAVNDLEESPDWLFRHPKLAWYSDAGNPSSPRLHNHGDRFVQAVPWSSLTIGEKIGESSKNTVYEGSLVDGRPVAVKLFGGALSTDGIPEDEMVASLLAGDHPNLIGAIGELIGAPDGQQGLIMPLISKEFKNLGKPPSFDRLVRDVYADGTAFSESFISRVASGIAAGMSHAAAEGVMHGDIYAHNIVSDSDGRSYLGDFGGASLYDPKSGAGKLREKVDVLGFGYLLDDLLDHREAPSGSDQSSGLVLERLRDACLSKIVEERPSFAEISETLEDN